jgi:ABC-2 type transport system permease protein
MKRHLRFAPGSLAWLVAHQLRLQMRGVRVGKVPGWVRWLGFAAMIAFMTATMGVGVWLGLRGMDRADPAVAASVGVMVAAVMVSGLSVNVMAAFAVLTDRDDLDLLLSAPVPPGRLAAARLLSGAVRSLAIYTTFAVVLMGVSAVMISPLLLSGMLLAPAIALTESATGFAISRSLMVRFGAVTGRKVAQAIGLAGMLVGVLGYQLANSAMLEADRADLRADAVPLPDTGFLPPALVPALETLGRAVLGGFAQAAGLLALGLVLFVLVVRFAGARFASDVARLQSEALAAPRRARQGPVRFAQGWIAAGLAKESRSMARDPVILSQVAIPFVALVPLGFMIARSEDGIDPVGAAVLVGVSVMLVSQICAALAWVCVSVEEAPDLLRAAPLHPSRHLLVKVLAVTVPSAVLLVLLAAVLVPLWPPGALWVLAGGIPASVATVAIEFWRPKPTRRAKTMTERADRSASSVIFGLAVSMLGAGFAGLGTAGLAGWALIPLGIGAIIVLLAWLTAPREVTQAGTGPLPPATGPWAQVTQPSAAGAGAADAAPASARPPGAGLASGGQQGPSAGA